MHQGHSVSTGETAGAPLCPDLDTMSAAELETKLGDLKKDLFQLRLQHATNQLENPIRIAEVKKDIARVKTILREQQGR